MNFLAAFKFNENHDERGRFASGGVGNADFTDADRKFIDIKPGRPLHGVPQDLRTIASLIPGAEYTPYTQTPFFDKLQEMQGTPDGEHLTGAGNKAARDVLFQVQPVENVPIAHLHFTQNVVNYPDVSKFFNPPEHFKGKTPAPAQVVEYGGQHYLMDGHHRAVADIINGKKRLRAYVLHIPKPKVKKFAALFTEAVAKYNTNHDEQGRFTFGGSAGSFPSVKGVRGFVRNILSNAKSAEPRVTSTLKAIADETRGALTGLEYRIKTADSLTRKIRDTAMIERRPVADVAADIKDALRYTLTFPTDQYASGVETAQSVMEQHGFKLIKFSDQRGDLGPDGQLSTYKGVNTAWKTPNGTVFELQYHTPESLALKEHNHTLYEQARLSSTDAETRRQLEEMMRRNAHSVHLPR